MKFNTKILNILLRLGASILILAFSVVVFRALLASRTAPARKAATENAVLVRTVRVQPHEGEIDLETSGLVVPFREITLSAEVAGKINFKSEKCKAGTYVEAGTKLIEVDCEEYELEVERAEAELRQAGDQLKELEQEIEGAELMVDIAASDEEIQQLELERIESLDDVVSNSELNQSRRALLAAQNAKLAQANQLDLLVKRKSRLQSGLDLAETKLKTARLNKRRAVIKAPSDGLIVSEMVEKDDFVQRGTQLLAFEDVSAAEVKISLRPDELQWILESARTKSLSTDESQTAPPLDPYTLPQVPAEIEFQYEGGTSKWSGVLSRYDGAGLDEMTRTVPCRVLIKNRMSDAGDAPTRQLVRGMFVEVNLKVRPQQQLLKVPESAVRAGDVLWCVRDGQLSRHQLTIVGVDETVAIKGAADQRTRQQLVFTATQLSPRANDLVVISPLVSPLEGMRVRVSEDETVTAENKTEKTPVAEAVEKSGRTKSDKAVESEKSKKDFS